MNKTKAINELNIYKGDKPGDSITISSGYRNDFDLELESLNISDDHYGACVGEGEKPEPALFVTITLKLTEAPEEETDGQAE